MARTCLSLKLRESDDPRWPDVPNSMRSAGTEGSGCSLWYAVTSFGTFTNSDGGAGLPANECTFGSLTDPQAFQSPGAISSIGSVLRRIALALGPSPFAPGTITRNSFA